VLTNPTMKRVLPGIAASCLGDGMSAVAISWLAIELAPEHQRGLWVAIALAAYGLPGAFGAILFNRLMSGRDGAQLAGWDATLRFCALGAVPVLHIFGLLSIEAYVVLLAVSSLFLSWGAAGRYTLVAELLPQQSRVAGNAVLTTLAEAGTLAGPVLAGVIIAWGGAVWAIAVDAATFGVLALTYLFAARHRRTRLPRRAPSSRSAGFRAIRANRRLANLIALTFFYFFLFGPVLVALPLYVSEDLGRSAGTLATYYTVFAVGSVLGGLAAGYLHRLPLWPASIFIVIAFGVAMLPLGFDTPQPISLLAFALAGLVWAPFPSITTALFQRSTTMEGLPQVLAARGAFTIIALPLGNGVAGPLIAAFGARGTLLACAIGTIVLGLVAAAMLALSGGDARSPSSGRPPAVTGPGG